MSTNVRIISNKTRGNQGVSLNSGSINLVSGGIDSTMFGTPNRNPIYASNIDTAPRRVGISEQTREIPLQLLITGASLNAVVQNQQSVISELEDCINYGGRLRWNSGALTGWIDFTVLYGQFNQLWSPRLEYGQFQCFVQLSLTVSPWGYGDPLSTFDDFSQDTMGTAGVYNIGGSDYSLKAGTQSDVSITGGVLTSVANHSVRKRWIHTGTGNSYGDQQATIKFKTPAVNGDTWTVALVLKYIDENNYLLIELVGIQGTSCTYAIKARVGGVTNTRTGPTGIGALNNAAWYWMRTRIEGNLVWVDVYSTTQMPTPNVAASLLSNFALTLGGSDATALGTGVNGQQGFEWIPGTALAQIDDYEEQSFVEKRALNSSNWPDEVVLGGTIPGDVPMEADISWATEGEASPPLWMLFAWMPKEPAYNYCWNDGAERDTRGWSVAAIVANSFMAAATSITRITGGANAYEGNAFFQLVTPATTNSGAAFHMYRKFRAGVTYTMELYARSSGGSTTAMRINVGDPNNGLGGMFNISGAATALTTTWTKYTQTWIPTWDSTDAYIAFVTSTATATTCQIDRVCVYEGTTAPTPLSGYNVSTVPGGHSPHGPVQAEADDPAARGAYWTLTADANYLTGNGLKGSGATASNAGAEWLLCPWTVVPDTPSGEYLMDVYARVEIASTITNPIFCISIIPEAGSSSGAPVAGTQTFTVQNTTGTIAGGMSLTSQIPSSGTARRNVFLGTLPVYVDLVNPQRVRLRLDVTAGGTGTLGIDAFILAGSLRSCFSQIGSPASGSFTSGDYPYFITGGSSSEFLEKTIRSDLSGLMRNWNAGGGAAANMANSGPVRDTGLGGSQIKIDSNRNIRLVAFPSEDVVMNPTSRSTSVAKSIAGIVRIDGRPKFYLARQN